MCNKGNTERTQPHVCTTPPQQSSLFLSVTPLHSILHRKYETFHNQRSAHVKRPKHQICSNYLKDSRVIWKMVHFLLLSPRALHSIFFAILPFSHSFCYTGEGLISISFSPIQENVCLGAYWKRAVQHSRMPRCCRKNSIREIRQR